MDAGDPDGQAALEALRPRTPLGVGSVALALAWARLVARDPAGARTAAVSGLAALDGTGARLLEAQLAATAAIAAARAGDVAAAEAWLPDRARTGQDIVGVLQRIARAEVASARGERARGLGDVVALAPRSIAVRLMLGPGGR